MPTEISILILGIVCTPLLDFKYDLLDSLNVRILVILTIAVVTITYYSVCKLDNPLTIPFYVNMHPPSKYIRSPVHPFTFVYK